MDRSNLDTLKNKKAQLTAPVTAMTEELREENEEICHYQAEYTVVLIESKNWLGAREISSTELIFMTNVWKRRIPPRPGKPTNYGQIFAFNEGYAEGDTEALAFARKP